MGSSPPVCPCCSSLPLTHQIPPGMHRALTGVATAEGGAARAECTVVQVAEMGRLGRKGLCRSAPERLQLLQQRGNSNSPQVKRLEIGWLLQHDVTYPHTEVNILMCCDTRFGKFCPRGSRLTISQ